MRSIFLSSETVYRVFDESSREILIKEANLDTKLYKKEDILSGGFEDVKYIFATWGMPEFTEEQINKYLPNTECVFYGAGTVQTFARPFLNTGKHIFSAWGANAVPVAEYTVAQIILANKGFYHSARKIKSKNSYGEAKSYFNKMPGNFNTNVGIIGAGMIGKLVIKMLKQYKLNVLVYDPFLKDEVARDLGVKKVTLEELFSSCFVISNHVANLPATVGMLNYNLFSLMKENAVFINTGRGAQVVEADLIKVLEEKPEITAVLDVTMPEPPEDENKFYKLDNVFLTPHIAGSAGNEVARMGEYMVDQFRKYAKGEPCEYEVSLKMLETMA